jgi:hypothetical protein
MNDHQLAQHLIGKYRDKGLPIPERLQRYASKVKPEVKKHKPLTKEEVKNRHDHFLNKFYKRQVG